MRNPMIRRAAVWLLTAILLLSPLCSLAQEEETAEQPVTHTAIATTTLKVRREPQKSSLGNDSIPRDSFVYIIELGDEWCKVRTSRVEGYVMTQYLADVREYNDLTQTSGASVEVGSTEEAAKAEPMPGFTTTKDTFREGYYAYAVKKALLFEQPDERSRTITSVPIYDQVIVSEVQGDWALARYNNYYGYIRTNGLFKWDRIDPYVGAIPEMTVWPYLAFTSHSTNVRAMKDNELLQTINPGAAICVNEMDSLGRYPLPYWRTEGYVMDNDIAKLVPVVPYDKAESGDLISVMTTYYAVGVSTLQFQGRNWNIRLASSMISGTVLQPGEEYNMNKVIGPYRKSTGYKSAPIMSKSALSGYGGGTCQVNTTFYNATIQVPLLVKHRRVHADVGTYYVPQGFDAAVGGGNINLIMENTLPYAIRYHCFISDGVLTVCIFRA